MIEAVLESLKDMPVVGMVILHVFGDAMNEVEKTKLTDDRGPKDEFEKIKELWECWEGQWPTCQKMMKKMNQDTTEPK